MIWSPTAKPVELPVPGKSGSALPSVTEMLVEPTVAAAASVVPASR